MLSQEDKPKRHRSAREVSHRTAILRSSVHRIIHQLKCFKRRRAQLLSASQSHLPSHALIINFPAINLVIVLSHYCSIILC